MNPTDEDEDDETGVAGGPSGVPAVLSRQRIDKWLWFARVAKTRTLAATLVTEGKVRVNGERVDKPGASVKPGEVVTIVMRQQVRILKVAGFAPRRGGAAIAATLFEDLSPRPEPGKDQIRPAKDGLREPGSGRPTKRQRREIDRFKSGSG
jgi:ribosome-associated heat shock protein Hsp15